MIYIMVSIFYTSHPENYSVLPAIASENQGLYSVSPVLDRNVVVVFFKFGMCFFFNLEYFLVIPFRRYKY